MRRRARVAGAHPAFATPLSRLTGAHECRRKFLVAREGALASLKSRSSAPASLSSFSMAVNRLGLRLKRCLVRLPVPGARAGQCHGTDPSERCKHPSTVSTLVSPGPISRTFSPSDMFAAFTIACKHKPGVMKTALHWCLQAPDRGPGAGNGTYAPPKQRLMCRSSGQATSSAALRARAACLRWERVRCLPLQQCPSARRALGRAARALLMKLRWRPLCDLATEHQPMVLCAGAACALACAPHVQERQRSPASADGLQMHLEMWAQATCNVT